MEGAEELTAEQLEVGDEIGPDEGLATLLGVTINERRQLLELAGHFQSWVGEDALGEGRVREHGNRRPRNFGRPSAGYGGRQQSRIGRGFHQVHQYLAHVSYQRLLPG